MPNVSEAEGSQFDVSHAVRGAVILTLNVSEAEGSQLNVPRGTSE